MRLLTVSLFCLIHSASAATQGTPSSYQQVMRFYAEHKTEQALQLAPQALDSLKDSYSIEQVVRVVEKILVLEQPRPQELHTYYEKALKKKLNPYLNKNFEEKLAAIKQVQDLAKVTSTKEKYDLGKNYYEAGIKARVGVPPFHQSQGYWLASYAFLKSYIEDSSSKANPDLELLAQSYYRLGVMSEELFSGLEQKHDRYFLDHFITHSLAPEVLNRLEQSLHRANRFEGKDRPLPESEEKWLEDYRKKLGQKHAE